MEPYSADDIKRRKRKFDFFYKKDILPKIIKSVSGIKKVILVDKTGLTIASVSKFSYFPVDIEEIGAIASAVFCASEEQGKNLDLGDLEIVTSEFSEGKIFASSCGPKGVLTLISDPDINIGLIRLMLKRSGDEMKEILDEIIPDIPETLDFGLDLSDLDELYPVKSEYYCQFCGRKLTKEEQFTHSCNRFYLG